MEGVVSKICMKFSIKGLWDCDLSDVQYRYFVSSGLCINFLSLKLVVWTLVMYKQLIQIGTLTLYSIQ